MKISQLISDFKTEFDDAVDYLNTTGVATRLSIGTPTLTGISSKRTTLDSAFGDYSNPLTHTPDSIIAVNNAYHAALKAYRALQKSLKNNTEITLLPADIAALHIHIDATPRRKVPAVDYAPNNTVIKQTHGVSQIFVNNPTPGQETKKAKPEDVAKIGRTICYVASGGPAPQRKEYHDLDSVGTVIFNIMHDADMTNFDCYLITWYVSPSGERGPESKPLKFTVI